MKQYVMGNGAIALGALAAGVNLVAGYPGTPSSEIIETVSKAPHEGVHVEWSVNEKAALEVAAAAAYSGARALVTMKQMGLNVASDALMSVAYVGVKGGLVVVSADDPGPISSQTEQDTRRFADFCRIPVFDPASPEEAFSMIQDAFELSEKCGTPVLFRPTTRVCHAYASVDVPEAFAPKAYEGFVRDPSRWVIFPRLSYANHGKMEQRNAELADALSSYRFNTAEGGPSRKAVAASGVTYAYVRECLKDHPEIRLIRIATAFPFPEPFVLSALEGAEEVLCLEELSPYVEEQILKTAGRHHLALRVRGKLDGAVPQNGELSTENAPRSCGIISVWTQLCPFWTPLALPPCRRGLRCSAPAVPTGRPSMPSSGPWRAARPSSAAISAAIPWATPCRSTWSTPACAWAPASPWPRGSATCIPTRSASPLSGTRPSSPPA